MHRQIILCLFAVSMAGCRSATPHPVVPRDDLKRRMLEQHLSESSRVNKRIRAELSHESETNRGLAEELRKTQEELAALLVALDPLWGQSIPVSVAWFRCGGIKPHHLVLTPIGTRDKTPISFPLSPPRTTPENFYFEPKVRRIPVGLYKITCYREGKLLFKAERPCAISSLLHKSVIVDEQGREIPTPAKRCTIVILPQSGYRLIYKPNTH